jgi:hypothetical protein
MALRGGYLNLLAGDATDRAMESYDLKPKGASGQRHYDPDNFFSASPLTVQHQIAAE